MDTRCAKLPTESGTEGSVEGDLRWFCAGGELALSLSSGGVRVQTKDLQDHDRLSHLLKQHFSITLETKEASFKGWNWGVTDFQGMHGCICIYFCC